MRACGVKPIFDIGASLLFSTQYTQTRTRFIDFKPGIKLSIMTQVLGFLSGFASIPIFGTDRGVSKVNPEVLEDLKTSQASVST